ncbi:MAG: GNAT family N-acetyltransferase [Clostridia bacterium]|nr:GNAT family N-acetyltransferase [Clostridia bacterium]
MIEIVEYEDKYLKDITELYNLWDGLEDLSCEQMQKTIDAYRKNTENKTFIAVDENGTGVGYIFFGPVYLLGVPPFVEIIQIMIKESHRGQGIGKRLMQLAENEYRNTDIKEARLHSRVVLKKAHTFYEGLGFKEFKESKFFIKSIDYTNQ